MSSKKHSSRQPKKSSRLRTTGVPQKSSRRAAPPPPPKSLSLPELKKLLQEWQARLRLLDWDIELRLLKWHPRHAGLNAMRAWVKRSTIDIFKMKPGEDIDPMEYTLIHELLHLHVISFMPMPAKPVILNAMESSIDIIAGTLFKLKYPQYEP